MQQRADSLQPEALTCYLKEIDGESESEGRLCAADAGLLILKLEPVLTVVALVRAPELPRQGGR